jgi:protein phosphatase
MVTDEAAGHGLPAGNGRLAAGDVLSKLAWGLCSEPGAVREDNEDFAGAFAPTVPDDAWDRGPLFVVADGMGGHAAGELASRTAVESMLATWQTGAANDPFKTLRSATRQANTSVLNAGHDHGQLGLGTTLTALTLATREAIISHVGDSRAYLLRGQECTQLTSDHSRVGEMLRMRLLTPEQAARHPARSQLTRSLGTALSLQVDMLRLPIEAGDVFVLCSDGLWDEVGRRDISAVAGSLGGSANITPRTIAERLVGTAVERGAADNVTAVVVRVQSGLPIPSGTRRSIFRRSR